MLRAATLAPQRDQLLAQVSWFLNLEKVSIVMAQNEKTSTRVGAIAARALSNPQSVNSEEIKELAASVLSQSPDQQRSQQNAQHQHQKRSVHGLLPSAFRPKGRNGWVSS